ncbi:hypothetical protein GLAREA_11552 [Glarea lozoyensis ATCC 20868]|uniref:Uncharacterized protein n=1 Tax=Glarea lozoyensis (strain ATCC 20868 / MF5171) TaxID=1116229 RepID=S3CYR4_GLAL2|nr:uncharacterized protein GLAREA_11552 [Glarea lozoyensis ATCC 20868]EPE24971.1 hypothetical protein GLAREA_11552 [Glarea lozoyensis ATCC 20868]
MSKENVLVAGDVSATSRTTTIQHTNLRSISPESFTDKHLTSLPWILYHILEKQPSDELPLRIMFTFNAGQQLPTLRQAHQWWQYEPSGQKIIEFLSKTRSTSVDWKKEMEGNSSEQANASEIDQFLNANHKLLWDLSNYGDSASPCSRVKGFPVQFILHVCRHVFAKEYQSVDFTQALTCIDYLRDLECTRRSALRDAALRLGIERGNWRTILADEPEAYHWVSAVQKQELVIEASYAAIFLDLRIWTMIYELKSEPFYKPNVLAMLNTLFPPSMKDMPNDKVDIRTLEKYRATFYKYILTVDKEGTGILKEFVQKLLVPGTKHSWPETRRHLEEYITLAEVMIKEAKAVDGIDFFHDSSSVGHSRTISNACSAFSDRPASASSANTSYDDHRFSAHSASGPSAAKDDNNISNAALKWESHFLFDPDSKFESPPNPALSSKDSVKKTRLALKTDGFGGAAEPSINSPSTDPKTDFSSKASLSSIRIPVPVLSATETHSTTHSNPTTDSEMRAIRRAISRSVHPTADPVNSGDFDTSQSEHVSSMVISEHGSKQGDLDFLSRPYRANHSLSLEPAGTTKRKKSFSDMLLRRKQSVSREHSPFYSRSSSESSGTEPNRLRKLKSTSNIDKGQRAGAWIDSQDASLLEQPISADRTRKLNKDEKVGSLPGMKARKSFSLGRSRTPKYLDISKASPSEDSLKTPKTPTLFSRPKTPTFFSRPKTPTHDIEQPFPTLGSAGLVGSDDSDHTRSSALPIPLRIRKRMSRGKLSPEMEKEMDIERERQWLIENSLRERSRSRERSKAGEEEEVKKLEPNSPERRNGKKPMIWQDGGQSGKASGWVEFEMPREVPPVPPLPPKSALRGTKYY